MRRVLGAAAAATLLSICASPVHAADVVAAGGNAHLQLATGYRNVGASTLFVPSVVEGAVEVCGAGWWGAARMQDGTVEQWGGNEQGQSGTGTRVRFHPLPVKVPGLTGVVQIACSGEHMGAVLTGGTVALWGADRSGEDCDGKAAVQEPETRPYRVPGVTGVVQLSLGGASTWMLREDGTVIGCGENLKGQLGNGTTTDATTPVEAHLSSIKQIDGGGQALIGGLLLAVTTEGRVLAVGSNVFGQLGNGTQVNSLTPTQVIGLAHVRMVSTSFSNALAVLEDGSLYVWGEDTGGVLGVPASTPCDNGGRQRRCALTPRLVNGISGVELADAGLHYVLATSAQRLYAWGKNDQGQLGDGTKASKTNPTPAAGPVGGVTSIGGEESTTFAVTSSPLSPPIAVTATPHGLLVHWSWSGGREPWTIAYRVAGETGWGHASKLPANARSETIGGLSTGRSYEVKVASPGYGVKVATGAPT